LHPGPGLTQPSILSGSVNEYRVRQVRATLLGARHVPERLCGGYVYLACWRICVLKAVIELKSADKHDAVQWYTLYHQQDDTVTASSSITSAASLEVTT